ncbi:MAG: TIGR01777 family oxidoreductase [Chloroflexi bacterium]|nr:TIGR01777 family oxidoreductase [Chloroflexota bacterium]
MKVIIAGGSGLLGHTLAANLLQDGHQVIVLSRGASRPAGPQQPQVVHWDGQTTRGWGDVAEAADAIVNLAGENLSAGLWTAQRKRAILASRRNAGLAVAQVVAAARVKPQVVIQAAAVGYYGDRREADLAETEPPGDDFLAQVCQAWEDSSRGVEDLGVRRCVLRLGVILDRDSGVLPRMALTTRLFIGGPLGSGKQWLPWIHREDAAGAIRFLIETPSAHGVFNLVAPQVVTNRQFFQTLGKVMRRPSFMPAPSFAIRLLFGEMSMVVLTGQNVSARRLEQAGFQFKYGQLEAALRNIFQS